MNVQDLMRQMPLEDFLRLARYYYRIGNEIITDNEYNELLLKLPDSSILHSTLWSQDDVPYDLLKKFNLLHESNDQPNFNTSNIENTISNVNVNCRENYGLHDSYSVSEDTLRDALNYNSFMHTKSIALKKSYQEIEKWISNIIDVYGTVQLHASIKCDGMNITLVYINSKLCYAHTRERTTYNPQDVTDVLRCIVPNTVNTQLPICKVVGEILLPTNVLPYLRSKYHKPFKSSRNSLASVLSMTLDKDDVQLALFKAYKVICDGFKNLQQEFQWLISEGFYVPPYKLYTAYSPHIIHDIMQDFEPLRASLPYRSDGVVVSINDNCLFYDLGENRECFNGNIACKVGVWDGMSYTSTVVGLVLEHNTTYATPVLIIEPVEVSTGVTITRVSGFNLDILNRLNVGLGSQINFKLVSDVYPTLVYDKDAIESG